MPRTTSAKKALRQNIRRRKQNTKRKKQLQAVIKNFKKLILENKKKEAQTYLSAVYKIIDKSAKTYLIKKGKANRLKSQLSKKLT